MTEVGSRTRRRPKEWGYAAASMRKWEFFDSGLTGQSAEGVGHSVKAEGKEHNVWGKEHENLRAGLRNEFT